MIYNRKMEIYINEISKTSQITNDVSISIIQGLNCNDEPYFYLEDNCYKLNENSKIKHSKEMLTQLEWDCNEIYISGSKDVRYLLQTALIRVKSIETILKDQYPLYSFDIIMSIDDDTEPDVLPSITVRFYCIRDNDYYIAHNELEEFLQPVLIESISKI
ncbi:hypothetical protein JHL18_15020 [Clostridium sp. YIM B02505]|uniref:Uncharacterized protein n=1 Tax=Clostridium yunnanense TaxID=2800325 RepID=A0ABS1ERF2_9CLOT|nr:hypothetical protein [Clostridium yunnanense]MBK1811931.1 hypothetical protein [Clostridium yunnanense]